MGYIFSESLIFVTNIKYTKSKLKNPYTLKTKTESNATNDRESRRKIILLIHLIK